MGPFLLQPALKLTGGYDTNVYLAPENEQADTYVLLAPSLRVVLPLAALTARVDAEAVWRRYSNETVQNSDTYTLGGGLGGEFAGGLGFTLSDVISRGYIREQEEFIAEYYDTNRLYARLSYVSGERLKVEGEYLRYGIGYQETDELDRVENTLQLTGLLHLTRTVAFLADVSLGDIAYDHSADAAKDSSVLQWRVGMRWNAGGRAEGELRAGYLYKTFDDSRYADVEEFVGTGYLRYNLTDDTSFKLEARRATTETDFEGSVFYVSNRVQGTIDHRFTAKITGFLQGSWQRYDFPREVSEGDLVTDRTDTTVGGEVGIFFQMFRRFSLALDYGLFKRNSTLDRFDYTDQVTTLTARIGY